MTVVNALIWNEPDNQVSLDEQFATPNAGWTIGYLIVSRQTPMVFIHMEVTSDGTPSDGVVFVLPPDYAPTSTVTSADGAFTIDSAGHVTRVAGGGAGTARLDVCYGAPVS